MQIKQSSIIHHLQALCQPGSGELIAMSLASTASALRVDRVLVWLFDGSVLRLIAEPGIEATVPREVAPGQGTLGLCYEHGRMKALESPDIESWMSAAVMCDDEPVRGYLAPLRLAGQVVGALAALRAGEQSIEPVDIAAIEVQCLTLMLALHHCTVSPEMVPDWMSVFEERVGPSGGTHRLDNCPMLIGDELPKGIHGPTLKAMCKYFHNLGKQVTAKEIASTMGLSQVTVGRYLAYMIERRLVRRAIAHYRMGRPSYLYCSEQRCPQIRL